MDFKIEFIQICFRCSADFIQPSCLLFFDVVIDCSIYFAKLYACTIYITDLHACTIYIADLFDSGADPGFFLGGGALVSCSTSTPINHIVFFFGRITAVLENRRSSQGGGGCAPPAPSP